MKTVFCNVCGFEMLVSRNDKDMLYFCTRCLLDRPNECEEKRNS